MPSSPAVFDCFWVFLIALFVFYLRLKLFTTYNSQHPCCRLFERDFPFLCQHTSLFSTLSLAQRYAYESQWTCFFDMSKTEEILFFHISYSYSPTDSLLVLNSSEISSFPHISPQYISTAGSVEDTKAKKGEAERERKGGRQRMSARDVSEIASTKWWLWWDEWTRVFATWKNFFTVYDSPHSLFILIVHSALLCIYGFKFSSLFAEKSSRVSRKHHIFQI